MQNQNADRRAAGHDPQRLLQAAAGSRESSSPGDPEIDASVPGSGTQAEATDPEKKMGRAQDGPQQAIEGGQRRGNGR